MEFNRITFTESVEMIATVVNSIFKIDDATDKAVAYFPENYDYSFRLAVAHYYYGYEITGNVDKDYNRAMDVNIADKDIDQNQLLGIQNAINEKIEMRKSEINKANITVISQLDKSLESLTPMFENFGNTISKQLQKIDMEKLNEKIDGMNMENLVKQYMESAFADKNRNDLIDAKNEKIRSLQDRLNAVTGRNAYAGKH